MYKKKNEYQANVLSEHVWKISEEVYDFGSPWTIKQFLEDVLNPHSHYVLKMDGHQVIGFVAYHLVVDEAEIVNVAVGKKYQGKQVAFELFLETLASMKKQGVKSIFLEVRANNIPAIKLYKRMGFTLINKRKNYYSKPTEDGLLMCLEMK